MQQQQRGHQLPNCFSSSRIGSSWSKMEPQPQGGPQQGNQQMLMQMIQQLAQGQQQLQQALQESVSQQSQATARMSQAFQANMDQQLKIHQNVEKSIDVRDRSELKEAFPSLKSSQDCLVPGTLGTTSSRHGSNHVTRMQFKSSRSWNRQWMWLSRKDHLKMISLMGPSLFQLRLARLWFPWQKVKHWSIVKNTSRGTHFGLEALRRLLSKYDPQNPQANSALLKKVLHPQQCSLDKLREGLESWENLKRKYEERRKKQLEDDICRSCLQQMCPNKLQDHLDLQASRLTDYDSMKHEILAYIENVETRKEAKTGSAPMDVDSLAKSKRKRKGIQRKG